MDVCNGPLLMVACEPRKAGFKLEPSPVLSPSPLFQTAAQEPQSFPFKMKAHFFKLVLECVCIIVTGQRSMSDSFHMIPTRLFVYALYK